LAIALLARLATALTAVSGQRSCCLGCEIGHLLDDRLLRLVGPLLWFRFIGVHNETPAHDHPRLAHAAAASAARCQEVHGPVHPVQQMSYGETEHQYENGVRRRRFLGGQRRPACCLPERSGSRSEAEATDGRHLCRERRTRLGLWGAPNGVRTVAAACASADTRKPSASARCRAPKRRFSAESGAPQVLLVMHAVFSHRRVQRQSNRGLGTVPSEYALFIRAFLLRPVMRLLHFGILAIAAVSAWLVGRTGRSCRSAVLRR
jgi:hypothetical protein